MKVCLPVNNSFRKTRNNLFLCGLIVFASAAAFHTTWTFCQFFFLVCVDIPQTIFGIWIGASNVANSSSHLQWGFCQPSNLANGLSGWWTAFPKISPSPWFRVFAVIFKSSDPARGPKVQSNRKSALQHNICSLMDAFIQSALKCHECGLYTSECRRPPEVINLLTKNLNTRMHF